MLCFKRFTNEKLYSLIWFFLRHSSITGFFVAGFVVCICPSCRSYGQHYQKHLIQLKPFLRPTFVHTISVLQLNMKCPQLLMSNCTKSSRKLMTIGVTYYYKVVLNSVCEVWEKLPLMTWQQFMSFRNYIHIKWSIYNN